MRSENLNKLVFGHLNINSIGNKYEFLVDQVKGNIDAIMIAETKIDDNFPVDNFVIDGYSTLYRLDRNSNDGGILLYIKEVIPSYLVATEKEPVESFYVEINLRNKKYLISCSYNPQKIMVSNHLATLEKFLDLHSLKYEKVLILGDFNVGVNEQYMQSFCETYDLKSLIKQPTCYKNPNSPICIDLILTNVPCSFQSTGVIETGLLDFI